MTEIRKINCLHIFLIIWFFGLSNSTNFQPSGSIIGEMDISSPQIPILGLGHARSSDNSSNLAHNEVRSEVFDEYASNASVNANVSKSRSKRFIYFNVNAALDFGFLLTIPITIVLPPLSNLFNTWKYSKRSRRSMSEDEETVVYEDSPVFQPYLDRVNSYFELIKIPESSCQERAICEFSSDPDKYFPISNLILNQVREPALTAYFYEELGKGNGTQGLFKLFNAAAEKGLAYGHTACQKSYLTKCPYSLDTRLNQPILKFWQGLQSILNIEFQNES